MQSLGLILKRLWSKNYLCSKTCVAQSEMWISVPDEVLYWVLALSLLNATLDMSPNLSKPHFLLFRSTFKTMKCLLSFFVLCLLHETKKAPGSKTLIEWMILNSVASHPHPEHHLSGFCFVLSYPFKGCLVPEKVWHSDVSVARRGERRGHHWKKN